VALAQGGVGAAVQNFEIHRGATIHSSVPSIFFGFGTEKFSSVIFLGIEEYKKTEEDILFSYSVR
jgi:hypothetical protein